MRDTEAEAEEEAGSMQGARRGTRSQDPRITPWAEGSAKPLSHLGCPQVFLLSEKILLSYLNLIATQADIILI